MGSYYPSSCHQLVYLTFVFLGFRSNSLIYELDAGPRGAAQQNRLESGFILSQLAEYTAGKKPGRKLTLRRLSSGLFWFRCTDRVADDRFEGYSL